MHSLSKVSALAMTAATITLLSGAAGIAMTNQFNELDNTLRLDFEQLGIPVPDLHKLNYHQIGEISAILSSSDRGNEQKRQIEEILKAQPQHAVAMRSIREFPGAAEMEAIVVNDLRPLGIHVKNPGRLTVEQIERLNTILSSSETDARKKVEAEEVLAM
ncbi:hypothetical protein QKW60_13695 [Defluviimonas aestuarii]|uniref:hypothetical protein n=1 Tax=Albidovulum aestuarii TaxID=1130726 RepID=UPI00249C9DC7|nr:hypothetical protein [Defluviimonas aestuarii]MDI3337467.1 hypothetical protein [Defluviimonas aestuarii]